MIDFLLHADKKLLELVAAYGTWVYAILFAIVFAETGFVVTPFLPGDSLLFAAGALCATGVLSAPVAIGLLIVAAFTGNAVNYTVGRFIGPRVVSSPTTHRLINREYLDRAHAFFEKYGGKAIILGRFVPIVRTFVPFVAGAAQMSSGRNGPAGWRRICGTARATRRSPAAIATPPSWPTWSSTPSATWRRPSTGSADRLGPALPRRSGSRR